MILRSRASRGLLCVALATLALAGCGRRGPLEPPPEVPASQAVPTQVKTLDSMAGDPVPLNEKPTPPAPTPPSALAGKSFPLDDIVK